MSAPGYGLQLRTTTRVETTLRVDPRVVLSAKLLELSHNELDARIDAELNENPALERLHSGEEPITEAQILRRLSTHELKPRGDDRELWRSLPSDEVTPDWVDLAASHITLDQHLRAQMHPVVRNELHHVVEFVIGSLNPNGYLVESTEEIALATNVEMAEVEEVVRALRSCEPAGVGAANVVDCLTLQLKRDNSLESRLARRIVREHLDDFAARKAMRIARRFGVMPELVGRAFERILACTPFPVENFDLSPVVAKSFTAPAELRIERDDYGWTVEPQGFNPAALIVSSSYRAGLEEAPRGSDERRHLSHYVSRAGEFISALESRRLTLERIGHYLIERQGDFIVTGDYEYLTPLTRAEMANELELHESTVSRATQGKFVQIATGEIVSFEVFFKPALRVQKMIEGILAMEDPAYPLSDERIAEILASKGVVVARRTVNKYRDKNRLLSSRHRRVA